MATAAKSVDNESLKNSSVAEKYESISVEHTNSVRTSSINSSNHAVAEKMDEESSRNSRLRSIGLITLLVIGATLAAAIGLGFTGLGLGLRGKAKNTKDESDGTNSTNISNESDGTNSTNISNFLNEDMESWPELVGIPGENAEAILNNKYGDTYLIQLVEYGSFVTMDYRTDRIRLYLDVDGNVMNTPEAGR